jgi:hypothetical protein
MSMAKAFVCKSPPRIWTSTSSAGYLKVGKLLWEHSSKSRIVAKVRGGPVMDESVVSDFTKMHFMLSSEVQPELN